MKYILTLLVLALLPALAGCGGGGGGGGGVSPVTVTLYSTADMDGYVMSSLSWNRVNGIRVGDDDSFDNGREQRGLLSFDLSGIPAGATVTSATLRLYQFSVVGDPYTHYGSVWVESLDFGDSVGSSSFAVSALSTLTGSLSSDNVVTWKEISATNAVQADVAAARPRSQFRLNMPAHGVGTNGDNQTDDAVFEDGDDTFGSGNRPQLLVTYTAP